MPQPIAFRIEIGSPFAKQSMSTIIQHTRPAAGFAARSCDRHSACAAGASLTGADWEIVEMAAWDGPRSLNPKGLLARIERVLFGDVALPLAKARLESLRRFSVKAWYWNHLGERDIAAALDAGLSPIDVRQVLDHVASSRGFLPRMGSWPS